MAMSAVGAATRRDSWLATGAAAVIPILFGTLTAIAWKRLQLDR